MPLSPRSHIGTTLFATIVTALLLSSQAGQARDEVSSNAEPPRPAVIVHQLPRVVVTGRVQAVVPQGVVELPRVVVTGRRSDGATRLVQAPARAGERT